MSASPAPSPDPERVRAIAREAGESWRDTHYYDLAELFIDELWDELVFPLIADADFTAVVDLAAGHGRNTEKLRHLAGTVYVVDINEENVEHCRRRFAGDPRVEYVVCDGVSLAPIPDASITLVYSFDSLVHFDSDVVRSYLRDIARVLRPGGRGMIHHSNYVGNPTGDFRESPHWRAFMSRELFEHYCHKEGLRLLRARVIGWGGEHDRVEGLDCITVFERPEP